MVYTARTWWAISIWLGISRAMEATTCPIPDFGNFWAWKRCKSSPYWSFLRPAELQNVGDFFDLLMAPTQDKWAVWQSQKYPHKLSDSVMHFMTLSHIYVTYVTFRISRLENFDSNWPFWWSWIYSSFCGPVPACFWTVPIQKRKGNFRLLGRSLDGYPVAGKEDPPVCWV